MEFILDDTQQLLESTVRQFVSDKAPVSRIRQLRDEPLGLGYSRELWKEMAEMGWLGLHFPEEFGGAGLGFFEFALVLDAVGRELMPEPYFSTVVLSAQVLLEAGTLEQQQTWLPSVCEGRKTMALAYDEPKARYNHHHVLTSATKTDNGFVLSGRKIHVQDGGSANGLIVSARVSGEKRDSQGIALFLLDPHSKGLTKINQSRLDSRGSIILELDNVAVPASALIGTETCGGRILDHVMDRARIALSAEMLGGATKAFEMTLAYLKERIQFGVPIGSFQALQHRAAKLFTELQVAKSAVLAAAKTVDEDPGRVSLMASLAKAKCSQVFIAATNEGVQMHGGVGMTDEYDIGFYMKRARATDALLGDASYHRERWATLRGY